MAETDRGTTWASVAGRVLSGTATPVRPIPVVPINKQASEVFWVNALVGKLEDPTLIGCRVIASDDDSDGKDDVVIEPLSGETFGVQVTELTSEKERAQRSHARQYSKNVLACFEARGMSSDRKLAVVCLPPTDLARRYTLPTPEEIADLVAETLSGNQLELIVDLGAARILLHWVDEGELLVPSVGRIGFDCSLGELPRTIEYYCEAASELARKKIRAKSPWLLIWSTAIWRDKHWLEKDILAHLTEAFRDSAFECVFFAESMDCEEMFWPNLRVHQIKS